MTIWHVFALLLAIAGYWRSHNIIKTRWHNAGLRESSVFKRPDRMYYEGEDAVAIGKLIKLMSVILLLSTLTDIAGLHDLTLPVFIILIVLYNIAILAIYPAKSDIATKNGKRKNENVEVD